MIIYYFKIFIIISVIYLFYKSLFTNIERMTQEEEDTVIKNTVKNIYQKDIKMIRQFENWSKELQKDGLSVKKNLIIKKKFNIIQKGMIVAFNGVKAPEGWIICNGQNGTPDLRGRFIYGLGKNQGTHLGRVGGSDIHKLNINEMPKHTHIVNNSGGHVHQIHTRNDDFNYRGCPGGPSICINDSTTKKPLNSNAVNNHSHTIGQIGGNTSHNNMPPYQVFIYIMKL